jgi:hypothetical protein
MLMAVIAFWAVYYKVESSITRELLGRRYVSEASWLDRSEHSWLTAANTFWIRHFLDEVSSFSEIKFDRPAGSSEVQTTTIYTLRSPHDEASLVTWTIRVHREVGGIRSRRCAGKAGAMKHCQH